MRTEIYAPRETAIHALHPATKLALLGAALIAPFLTQRVEMQAVAVVAALGGARAARVLGEVLRPWKLIAFIFTFTLAFWAIYGWQRAGGASPGGAPLPSSPASALVVVPLAYALRVTAVFLFGLLFLATTRIEETVHALETFRVPRRLAFALGLAFRLVPLFLASAAAIVEAQEARGLDLRVGPLGARLRRYVPILIPIFMTSLRSADQMAMALEARGFGASGPRTRLRRYRFGAADAAGLALGAAFVALSLAFREGPYTMVP